MQNDKLFSKSDKTQRSPVQTRSVILRTQPTALIPNEPEQEKSMHKASGHDQPPIEQPRGARNEQPTYPHEHNQQNSETEHHDHSENESVMSERTLAYIADMKEELMRQNYAMANQMQDLIQQQQRDTYHQQTQMQDRIQQQQRDMQANFDIQFSKIMGVLNHKTKELPTDAPTSSNTNQDQKPNKPSKFKRSKKQKKCVTTAPNDSASAHEPPQQSTTITKLPISGDDSKTTQNDAKNAYLLSTDSERYNTAIVTTATLHRHLSSAQQKRSRPLPPRWGKVATHIAGQQETALKQTKHTP